MTNTENVKIYNFILFFRAIILLAPITLLFYQYNGLSSNELFFFQGVFYLTSIIMEIPVGYLSNLYSRKNLLALSFIIYLAVILSWLFFRGYYIVLIGEIFCAISKVIMDNVISGYLYNVLQSNDLESKMPKYYGYINSSLALGTAFAAIIGTLLYSKFGFNTLLITQTGIILTAILLLRELPNIKTLQYIPSELKKKSKSFLCSIKILLKKENLKYHILYSGILTSCSILFALSFQILIQNSHLPVLIFGLVAFLNHGIRATASYFAKLFDKFSLTKLSNILLYLYTLAFMLILLSNNYNNKVLTLISIGIICLFIGLQLIFTILHISRAHTLIINKQRGTLMAVNNFVSRFLAALVLITSKIFTNTQTGFEFYYMIMLILFIIISLRLVLKISKQKVIE